MAIQRTTGGFILKTGTQIANECCCGTTFQPTLDCGTTGGAAQNPIPSMVLTVTGHTSRIYWAGAKWEVSEQGVPKEVCPASYQLRTTGSVRGETWIAKSQTPLANQFISSRGFRDLWLVRNFQTTGAPSQFENRAQLNAFEYYGNASFLCPGCIFVTLAVTSGVGSFTPTSMNQSLRRGIASNPRTADSIYQTYQGTRVSPASCIQPVGIPSINDNRLAQVNGIGPGITGQHKAKGVTYTYYQGTNW